MDFQGAEIRAAHGRFLGAGVWAVGGHECPPQGASSIIGAGHPPHRRAKGENLPIRADRQLDVGWAASLNIPDLVDGEWQLLTIRI